ncbi:MAG: hypothetical protein KBC11_03265 [Candidatus Pacebacteria bacterium]|nr:hypothetical protein [Candidatus Paceibacterota bacterium]
MIVSRTHLFFKKFFGVALLLGLVYVPVVSASDMTSSNFIIRDPLVGTGGSYGSSASFQAFGSGDLTNIGRSSSTSFEGRYGFLWFPYVIQGVFNAVANGSDADLTWGASSSGLGWNVSGYKTGKSSVPGGPYTYTDVGLVTNYTYSSLTPGQYCFVLQTYEAFGNVIATSAEECIDILPALTFAVSTSSITFGNLSSVIARYADTSTGSSSNVVAHTMAASSNAPYGYTITYEAPTLTSGANTITPATIVNSATGTAGTKQFALSLSSSGSATIPTDYNQTIGSGNWKFVANTIEPIASTSGFTATETFSNRFISNIDAGTPAGNYSTNIVYVITSNF